MPYIFFWFLMNAWSKLNPLCICYKEWTKSFYVTLQNLEFIIIQRPIYWLYTECLFPFDATQFLRCIKFHRTNRSNVWILPLQPCTRWFHYKNILEIVQLYTSYLRINRILNCWKYIPKIWHCSIKPILSPFLVEQRCVHGQKNEINA